MNVPVPNCSKYNSVNDGFVIVSDNGAVALSLELFNEFSNRVSKNCELTFESFCRSVASTYMEHSSICPEFVAPSLFVKAWTQHVRLQLREVSGSFTCQCVECADVLIDGLTLKTKMALAKHLRGIGVRDLMHMKKKTDKLSFYLGSGPVTEAKSRFLTHLVSNNYMVPAGPTARVFVDDWHDLSVSVGVGPYAGNVTLLREFFEDLVRVEKSKRTSAPNACHLLAALLGDVPLVSIVKQPDIASLWFRLVDGEVLNNDELNKVKMYSATLAFNLVDIFPKLFDWQSPFSERTSRTCEKFVRSFMEEVQVEYTRIGTLPPDLPVEGVEANEGARFHFGAQFSQVPLRQTLACVRCGRLRKRGKLLQLQEQIRQNANIHRRVHRILVRHMWCGVRVRYVPQHG